MQFRSRLSLPFILAPAHATSALRIDDISELDAWATADSLPAPGKNLDGTSVFTNYFNAFKEEGLFWKVNFYVQYEKPGAEIVAGAGVFIWCSNLHFTDFDSQQPVGYTGNCLEWISNSNANVTAGAELGSGIAPDAALATGGVSAVYVPQTNVFECQFHDNTKDYIYRMWDDGRPSMAALLWETHDEGDPHPGASTSAWSGVNEVGWMAANDASKLLNMSVTDLTPETFDEMYAKKWMESHEGESVAETPNSDAESAAVEEVKGETKNGTESYGDVVGEDAPGDEMKNGTETSDAVGGEKKPAEEDVDDQATDASSGTGRVVTAANCILAAALGLFGT